MNPFISIYTEVLWRPLFNGLIWFYNVLPGQDIGLAIVALTIVIRLILTPLLWKAQRAQKDLAILQPQIKEVQERFKDNREVQGKALMELYAKHKLNPFSGCLIMLLQLPILIALFQVFQQGLDPGQLKYLYPSIPSPGSVNPLSFGIIDLSRGNIYLGILAAVAQYFQTKLSTPRDAKPPQRGDFQSMLRWQTLYFFPALILFWSVTLPAALTLYWTVLNILGIIQEIVTRRWYGAGVNKN